MLNRTIENVLSLFPGTSAADWAQHPKGGGWVQITAKVEASATVGPWALVYGAAQVYGHAQVYDQSQVCGQAHVYSHAQVGGEAQIKKVGDVVVIAGVFHWAITLVLPQKTMSIGCQAKPIAAWRAMTDQQVKKFAADHGTSLANGEREKIRALLDVFDPPELAKIAKK